MDGSVKGRGTDGLFAGLIGRQLSFSPRMEWETSSFWLGLVHQTNEMPYAGNSPSGDTT